MPEHAARIAHRRLRRHRAVGDDLADAIATVFLRDVVDHLVAADHAEVDVEVRHRHTFGVEEAFEQQVVADRVEVGDAERVGDKRTRARAASRPDRYCVLLGPVDEVRDDQEVAGEIHRDDDAEFLVESPHVRRDIESFRWPQFCEPRREPFMALQAHPRVHRVFSRHRKRGQIILAELEFEVAALREFDAVLQRLWNICEQRGHLVFGLQVLFGAVVVWSARIVQHHAARDAHARFVRIEIRAFEEAHIVARDHRKIAAASEFDCSGVEFLFVLAASARELQIQAAVE